MKKVLFVLMMIASILSFTDFICTFAKEGAALAGAYLASIDPSSSYRDEALALAEQIRKRIGDDWEFAKEQQRDAVALEKARIEAIRAIGVAYGENQKALTVRENWMIR